MAEILTAFLNVVGVIFYMVAFVGVVVVLVGAASLFMVLAAGFGKEWLKEHEENNRGH